MTPRLFIKAKLTVETKKTTEEKTLSSRRSRCSRLLDAMHCVWTVDHDPDYIFVSNIKHLQPKQFFRSRASPSFDQDGKFSN